jgi:hypothetical protein
MKNPIQCELWEKPELASGPMKDRFELLETFEDESHLWRYLLKCRECGQLYFYEFYEEIDWVDGEDPQYVTYIPVETEAEIEVLKKCTPIELCGYFPRLQRDFAKGAKEPTVRWVGK